MARSKVLRDPFLSSTYSGIFQAQHKIIGTSCEVILEIGSAGGITKILNNKIVTSDVRPAIGVDLVIDASQPLPFGQNSVEGLIAKDVLHHLPDPVAHFNEIGRVLKLGATAVYAEPNWNLISRFVFYFFHPEPWIHQTNWKFKSTDPMFANQALPWIIFIRDRNEFESEFPNLEVSISKIPLNGLAFLISGGVYNRTKISSDLLIKLAAWENNHPMWMKFFGLTRIIAIKKIT